MSVQRFICLFFLAAGFAAAQDREVTHDVVISVGDFDIDEYGVHFNSILQKAFDDDASLVPAAQPDVYDWASQSLRLSETMHLGKYIAVEGGLNYFGESDMEAHETIPGSIGEDAVDQYTYRIKARYTAFDLGVVGKLPLWGKRLVAFGAVGGLYSRGEYTVDTTVTNLITGSSTSLNRRHQDETDLAAQYGAGVYGLIGDSFVVRFDYKKLKLDQLDTDTLALGIGFRYQ